MMDAVSHVLMRRTNEGDARNWRMAQSSLMPNSSTICFRTLIVELTHSPSQLCHAFSKTASVYRSKPNRSEIDAALALFGSRRTVLVLETAAEDCCFSAWRLDHRCGTCRQDCRERDSLCIIRFVFLVNGSSSNSNLGITDVQSLHSTPAKVEPLSRDERDIEEIKSTMKHIVCLCLGLGLMALLLKEMPQRFGPSVDSLEKIEDNIWNNRNTRQVFKVLMVESTHCHFIRLLESCSNWLHVPADLDARPFIEVTN